MPVPNTEKKPYLFDSDGSGDTLDTWATAPSLPNALAYSQAVVTKSRVYLLGGIYDGDFTSDVYTAPVSLDGTLGTWTTGPSLPNALSDAQVIVTKSRVYLLGGYNDSGVTKAVLTAPINLDGTLGTWTTASPLPKPLAYSQTIVTKSRVYLLGGRNANGKVTNAVLTTPINPDGTLGTWTTAPSLPNNLQSSQAVVTKNRVYLLGGYNHTGITNAILTAPINLDGTLGTWTTVSPLPNTLCDSQVIVTKNRVYLLGGTDDGGPTNAVLTSPINLDGTLGTWTTAPSLPNALYSSQVIVTKSRVYLLGGHNDGGFTSDVYTAPTKE